MTEPIEYELREQLRAVVGRQPVTEAELRKLTEAGRASLVTLSADLERSEQRLEELAADPTSSLAEIADTLRAVGVLRPDLDELHSLLAELEGRAREFRAGWLSAR